MAEAVIAGRRPARLVLEAGKTYHWCRCGRSGGQPFCDGAHRDTGIAPLAFEHTAPGQAVLCLCKRTANPPYCDGAHKRIDDGSGRKYWLRVAAVDEITEGEVQAVRAGGRAIALALVNGRHRALAGQCPHEGGGSLGEGRIDDEGLLRCPCHGRGFSPRNGSGSDGTGVEVFPVERRKDGIYVLLVAAE
ncbi:MAG: CDGSH iron-sulfur domain-containing protein [Alphaproteobacteria bacterium]|jgi:CDGSH-type Zn-finger protein|nr:CDGSH iron-sulfur domain-containing protein [Alphaproteobacteria bacterium]